MATHLHTLDVGVPEWPLGRRCAATSGAFCQSSVLPLRPFCRLPCHGTTLLSSDRGLSPEPPRNHFQTPSVLRNVPGEGLRRKGGFSAFLMPQSIVPRSGHAQPEPRTRKNKGMIGDDTTALKSLENEEHEARLKQVERDTERAEATTATVATPSDQAPRPGAQGGTPVETTVCARKISYGFLSANARPLGIGGRRTVSKGSDLLAARRRTGRRRTWTQRRALRSGPLRRAPLRRAPSPRASRSSSKPFRVRVPSSLFVLLWSRREPS